MSIALIYTNVLHHKICTSGNCYGNSTETFCNCKICGQHIKSPQHLYWTCPFIGVNCPKNDDWKIHFQNLLYVENSKSDIVIDLTDQILTDDKLDAELTEEELIQVVNKTKTNKAPRSVSVSINCVKFNLPVLLPLNLQLFNSILSQEVIPKNWRVSLLQPLYKNKGDVKNPDNYRGLAIGNSFFEKFHISFTSQII